jgi:hypothetical protein
LTENWRIGGLLADWRIIGGLADLADWRIPPIFRQLIKYVSNWINHIKKFSKNILNYNN